jgi:hypothetical protein
MKRLKKKLLHLFSPLLIFLIVLIIWDPFYVFFNYDEYYDNRITKNREWVALNQLKKRNFEPTNFIIGSSRSQAFKVESWYKYLGVDKFRCFHYDGIGMGLFRATNGIKYLEKQNKIDEVFLVTDYDFFSEIANPKELLKTQPPEVSNQDYIRFYSNYVRASAQFSFILANILYYLSGEYYPFLMDGLIESANIYHIPTNETGDVKYHHLDSLINADSVNYYTSLNNTRQSFGFYLRPKQQQTHLRVIKDQQLKMLREIKDVISRNNAKIKIIISPLYDQKKLHFEDIKSLQNIFGLDNIFDFSGINEFTENGGNYYENSHYRPHVAEQIFELLYDSK